MSEIKTLEQGRAEFAFKCAEEGQKYSSEYKSYVKKIPMLIKTNGLGATMAFIFSKATWKDKNGNVKLNTYATIYKQTSEWIKDEKKLLKFTENNFAKKLTQINSSEYRFITIEVLALFTWMRRFAEGLITKD